jgi:hypothetical protein
MTTVTLGLFFIRQGRASSPAVSTHTTDVEFALKLRLLDHQGQTRKERATLPAGSVRKHALSTPRIPTSSLEMRCRWS